MWGNFTWNRVNVRKKLPFAFFKFGVTSMLTGGCYGPCIAPIKSSYLVILKFLQWHLVVQSKVGAFLKWVTQHRYWVAVPWRVGEIVREFLSAWRERCSLRVKCLCSRELWVLSSCSEMLVAAERRRHREHCGTRGRRRSSDDGHAQHVRPMAPHKPRRGDRHPAADAAGHARQLWHRADRRRRVVSVVAWEIRHGARCQHGSDDPRHVRGPASATTMVVHTHPRRCGTWVCCLLTYLSLGVRSVLWRCWLGGRKGIQPVKNWVVGCWRGYLSRVSCRLAYGQADAIATLCLLRRKNPDWFYFSGTGLPG